MNKPRNFVAKYAKRSGAGSHSKTTKQRRLQEKKELKKLFH